MYVCILVYLYWELGFGIGTCFFLRIIKADWSELEHTRSRSRFWNDFQFSTFYALHLSTFHVMYVCTCIPNADCTSSLQFNCEITNLITILLNILFGFYRAIFRFLKLLFRTTFNTHLYTGSSFFWRWKILNLNLYLSTNIQYTIHTHSTLSLCLRTHELK
jgi:hypothetical protein